MPEQVMEILEKDFTKTVLDYTLFERGVDLKTYKERLLDSVIYDSRINTRKDNISIVVKKKDGKNE